MYYSDKPGKHGTVIRVNAFSAAGNSSVMATDDFIANLLTYNAIEIGISSSKFTTIFVAPRSVYSNIHKKSVTNLNSVCVMYGYLNIKHINIELTFRLHVSIYQKVQFVFLYQVRMIQKL